jgi:tRNA (guanine-N7-)-methyltransferase
MPGGHGSKCRTIASGRNHYFRGIMGKNKLRRFAELETMERVFQPKGLYLDRDSEIKGKWHETVFKNSHPIVIELGCGRGEYTVGMARMHPERNYVGVDKKGARLWRGAKTINEEQIMNAAFLRVQIQQVEAFFATGEVDEIWITFPDPQPQQTRENLRLTAPKFLAMYRNMLSQNGCIHLKTDNKAFYDYSCEAAGIAGAKIIYSTDNLYRDISDNAILEIKTTYEMRFLEQGIPICYLKFSFQ